MVVDFRSTRATVNRHAVEFCDVRREGLWTWRGSYPAPGYDRKNNLGQVAGRKLVGQAQGTSETFPLFSL